MQHKKNSEYRLLYGAKRRQKVRRQRNVTIHLSGQGVNPNWNTHQSVEVLQGFQRASMLLIEELDKHIAQRDVGPAGRHREEMKGNAIAAIMVTSFAVEIAIKTLHALKKPNAVPPRGHDLLDLFDALDQETQLKAQHMLETLPVIGEPDWVGENPDIRELIKVGRSNFKDWRYLPEIQTVGNGVPKGLVNVAQALRGVCLEHVLPESQVNRDGK